MVSSKQEAEKSFKCFAKYERNHSIGTKLEKGCQQLGITKGYFNELSVAFWFLLLRNKSNSNPPPRLTSSEINKNTSPLDEDV